MRMTGIEFEVGQTKKVIERAVVGIVDMVSSTKLSNSVDVFTDFEIKEAFLKAAQERASQTGMVILGHTGDGFLFLANPKVGMNWTHGLAKFKSLVVKDFQSILGHYSSQIGDVRSGVRFGVACGPVIVGRVGNANASYMAAGAAINLAARLCASAEIDEMVMSAGAWEVFGVMQADIQVSMCAYNSLKGFDHAVLAFHVKAAGASGSNRDIVVRESKRWTGAVVATAA